MVSNQIVRTVLLVDIRLYMKCDHHRVKRHRRFADLDDRPDRKSKGHKRARASHIQARNKK